MVLRFLLLIAMAVLLTLMVLGSRAPGEVYIKNDPGGLVADYAKKYGDILRRGEYVHISGYCASACTMALIIPRHRICADADAVFGFHSPVDQNGKIDPALTWQFYKTFYPPEIQRRLAARPLTTDLLIVPATTLVPECGK